jgi:hypothetical protein
MNMGKQKICVAVTSLALAGAATLTATASPAQSVSGTAPVSVSISNLRAITMPTSVQPGVNTFTITTANRRGSAFQLALPAAGYTTAEAAHDIAKGIDGNNVKALKRFEANVTLMGGVGVTKGHVGTLVVDLDLGTYWAVDTNAKAAPGKFFTFQVEGAETGNVAPAAGATIRAVKDTTWANKPASIPSKGLLRFKNSASQNHFIVMVQLKKGVTFKEFKTWFLDTNGPSGPPPANFNVGLDSGVLSPGHSETFRYHLPKGNYALLCFWPDAKMNGMPHAFMGMLRPITLK